jgi:hypothetical protein
LAQIVTIARFSTAAEANLARTQLEAEGIRAFVANELSMLSGLGNNEAIELQVLRPDAVRAAEVLGEHEPGQQIEAWGRTEEPIERCLVCQSSFVEVESLALPLRVLHALLSAALPIPDAVFASKRRVCGVCGYRWREGEGATTRAPDTPS